MGTVVALLLFLQVATPEDSNWWIYVLEGWLLS
jgi:hypothetical protein